MKTMLATAVMAVILATAPALAGEKADADVEETKTAGEVYSSFDIGPLEAAKLEEMDPGVVARIDGKTITAEDIAKMIMRVPEQNRRLYEMTKPFLLAQMLQREALLAEARRRGMPAGEESDRDVIGRMVDDVIAKVTVSDEEIKAAYDELKPMFGGKELEDVKEDLRKYVLRAKSTAAVQKFMDEVAKKADVTLNRAWAAEQHRLMTDNPLGKARASGKVTVVEFFSERCPPCKVLAPIMEDLKKELADVNVIKIDVDKHPEFMIRYQARATPTIIFFDADGRQTDFVEGLLSKAQILEKIEAARRPTSEGQAPKE